MRKHNNLPLPFYLSLIKKRTKGTKVKRFGKADYFIIFHQNFNVFENSRERRTVNEMIQLVWIRFANPTSERLSLGLRINYSSLGLELCIGMLSIRALE